MYKHLRILGTGIGLLFACLLLTTGCGRGKGTVKGKVTYKGEALTFGYVQIEAEGGGVFVGKIEMDGTYTVADVPTGQAKVLVSSVDDKYADRMKELSANARKGIKVELKEN